MVVLDAVLSAIGMNNYYDYTRIYSPMNAILESYKPNMINRTLDDIDFNREEYRDAYCFIFCANHIHMTKKIFENAMQHQTWMDWLNALKSRQRCKVVCVGTYRAGLLNWRPAGQIRPAGPFHPARASRRVTEK